MERGERIKTAAKGHQRVDSAQDETIIEAPTRNTRAPDDLEADDHKYPSYRYGTLKSRQTIRLMRLVPGCKTACELFCVDIHKAPPYLALSYTWGQTLTAVSMLVDGCSISVPENLINAVDALREFITKKRLMLWADSVCINQQDLQERGHQIKLMHSIYRCAECVGIWLGPSTESSDLAMDSMTSWKAELDRFSEPYDDNWELAITSITTSNASFFNAKNSMAWKSFKTLIQREWWTRAWIMQEATALGPSRTMVFCGRKMVDWSALRAALRLSHHVLHVETQGMGLTWGEGLTAARLDQFRLDREQGAFIRLFKVLELARPFDCKDPRDKLYACLGPAADIIEDDIVPDYSKPVEDVYTDIARLSLARSKTHPLDFLGLVAHFPEEYGGLDREFPSWVPDLRARFSRYALELYEGEEEFRSPRAYCAFKGQVAPITINNRCLTVHGFAVSRITKVYEACYHNLATGSLDVERAWWPDDEDEEYKLGGTVIDAYNHTLLADISRPCVTSEALRRNSKVDWRLVNSDPAGLSAERKQSRSHMLVDIKTMTFGRRLIRTDNQLMGLAPGVAEVGDIVCVLEGGHVLYVLRNGDNPNLFEFIGECYIHGLMDGQAMGLELSRRKFILV